MAQAVGNTISVAVGGLAEWVRLSLGGNRINVTSADWGTTRAGLCYSKDGTNANVVVVKDRIGGSEVVATENEAYDMDGPGWVTIDVTNYAGTPKILHVESAKQKSVGEGTTQ